MVSLEDRLTKGYGVDVDVSNALATEKANRMLNSHGTSVGGEFEIADRLMDLMSLLYLMGEEHRNESFFASWKNESAKGIFLQLNTSYDAEKDGSKDCLLKYISETFLPEYSISYQRVERLVSESNANEFCKKIDFALIGLIRSTSGRSVSSYLLHSVLTDLQRQIDGTSLPRCSGMMLVMNNLWNSLIRTSKILSNAVPQRTEYEYAQDFPTLLHSLCIVGRRFQKDCRMSYDYDEAGTGVNDPSLYFETSFLRSMSECIRRDPPPNKMEGKVIQTARHYINEDSVGSNRNIPDRETLYGQEFACLSVPTKWKAFKKSVNSAKPYEAFEYSDVFNRESLEYNGIRSALTTAVQNLHDTTRSGASISEFDVTIDAQSTNPKFNIFDHVLVTIGSGETYVCRPRFDGFDDNFKMDAFRRFNESTMRMSFDFSSVGRSWVPCALLNLTFRLVPKIPPKSSRLLNQLYKKGRLATSWVYKLLTSVLKLSRRVTLVSGTTITLASVATKLAVNEEDLTSALKGEAHEVATLLTEIGGISAVWDLISDLRESNRDRFDPLLSLNESSFPDAIIFRTKFMANERCHGSALDEIKCTIECSKEMLRTTYRRSTAMKDNMPVAYTLSQWWGVDQPIKQAYEAYAAFQSDSVPLTKEEFNKQFEDIFTASQKLDKTIQETLDAFKTNLIGKDSSQLRELKGRMSNSVNELTKQLLDPDPAFEKFKESLREEFTKMDSGAFPSTHDSTHEPFLESVSRATVALTTFYSGDMDWSVFELDQETYDKIRKSTTVFEEDSPLSSDQEGIVFTTVNNYLSGRGKRELSQFIIRTKDSKAYYYAYPTLSQVLTTVEQTKNPTVSSVAEILSSMVNSYDLTELLQATTPITDLVALYISSVSLHTSIEGGATSILNRIGGRVSVIGHGLAFKGRTLANLMLMSLPAYRDAIAAAARLADEAKKTSLKFEESLTRSANREKAAASSPDQSTRILDPTYAQTLSEAATYVYEYVCGVVSNIFFRSGKFLVDNVSGETTRSLHTFLQDYVGTWWSDNEVAKDLARYSDYVEDLKAAVYRVTTVPEDEVVVPFTPIDWLEQQRANVGTCLSNPASPRLPPNLTPRLPDSATVSIPLTQGNRRTRLRQSITKRRLTNKGVLRWQVKDLEDEQFEARLQEWMRTTSRASNRPSTEGMTEAQEMTLTDLMIARNAQHVTNHPNSALTILGLTNFYQEACVDVRMARSIPFLRMVKRKETFVEAILHMRTLLGHPELSPLQEEGCAFALHFMHLVLLGTGMLEWNQAKMTLSEANLTGLVTQFKSLSSPDRLRLLREATSSNFSIASSVYIAYTRNETLEDDQDQYLKTTVEGLRAQEANGVELLRRRICNKETGIMEQLNTPQLSYMFWPNDNTKEANVFRNTLMQTILSLKTTATSQNDEPSMHIKVQFVNSIVAYCAGCCDDAVKQTSSFVVSHFKQGGQGGLETLTMQQKHEICDEAIDHICKIIQHHQHSTANEAIGNRKVNVAGPSAASPPDREIKKKIHGILNKYLDTNICFCNVFLTIVHFSLFSSLVNHSEVLFKDSTAATRLFTSVFSFTDAATFSRRLTVSTRTNNICNALILFVAMFTALAPVGLPASAQAAVAGSLSAYNEGLLDWFVQCKRCVVSLVYNDNDEDALQWLSENLSHPANQQLIRDFQTNMQDTQRREMALLFASICISVGSTNSLSIPGFVIQGGGGLVSGVFQEVMSFVRPYQIRLREVRDDDSYDTLFKVISGTTRVVKVLGRTGMSGTRFLVVKGGKMALNVVSMSVAGTVAGIGATLGSGLLGFTSGAAGTAAEAVAGAAIGGKNEDDEKRPEEDDTTLVYESTLFDLYLPTNTQVSAFSDDLGFYE